MNPKKTLTIFTHIPKSGGTTFNSIIKTQYPEKGYFVMIPDDPVKKSLQDLETKIEKEGVGLVGGHVQFGLHQFLSQPCQYITFLRNPIELTLSHYYFFRLKKEYRSSIKEIVKFAQTHSVEEYCCKIHSNAMTRFISGVDFDELYKWGYLKYLEKKIMNLAPSDEEDASEEMLEAAKSNLKNYFQVVGLTERFDETLILLKEKLSWRNVHYLKKNTTKNRPKSEQHSSQVLATLKKYNELDLELYSYAEELFEKQIKNHGGNFQSQLKLFQILNGQGSKIKAIRKKGSSLKKKILNQLNR